jgi:polar amino acid transport system substrate-binding protein
LKLRWVLVALLAATPHLTAQEKKPELRWGTDPTGGGPYVYQEGTQEYIGFEVELASYLAQKIGRTPVMKKGDWKALPELLDKSTDADEAIDIVLNGYELREDLTKRYSATLPYYAYRLVLIAREDNNEINNWSDLAVAKPRMKSVGVLTGTVAQEELKAVYGPLVNAAVSDDVENVVGLVKDKRLDATLQDSPAGVYFLKKYGGLKIAGPPRQLNYYVIYLRKDDKELTDALNAAIRAGFEDGTLQKIYQKYGLWNEDQKWLNFTQTGKWPETIEPPSDPSGTRNEKDAKVEKTSPWSWMLMDLLQAAGMTVLLAITSFPIAMLMGLLIALVRVYAHWIIAIPFGI